MCARASNGSSRVTRTGSQGIAEYSHIHNRKTTSRSEVARKLDGATGFIVMQPIKEGIIRYIHEKLRSDTTPEVMSSTLAANIMKIIPEVSSETYVGTRAGAKLPEDKG